MANTFADVVKVKPLNSHQYETVLDDAWSVGTVPNGGYVTSTFMVVASRHMQFAHPNRKVKDVINLHLEFFKRTSVGPARFTVQDVKIGSRVSNLHITLAQKAGGSDKYVDEVQGYFTLSNLANEQGLTFDTEYRLQPPPLEVDLQALGQDKDANYVRRGKDPFGNFRRAVLNIQLYLPKPERRPKEFPTAIIDQWIRFAPGGRQTAETRWTNDALGYVVDIFPQMVEKYVNPRLEEATIGHDLNEEEVKYLKSLAPGSARYWYPTLALNLDVKKLLPPEGVEWLFVRVQSRKIQNGRFDLNIEVLDESGELVAVSSHASLIVDSSRNTTRKKGHSSKI